MSLSDKILFAKIKPGATIPSKREEDGAFDVYACFEQDYLVIKPHETVMIPTGLISAFSLDYVAILKERGSNGSKGIGQRAGVIDSGYRGEWLVPLTNHNDQTMILMKEHVILRKEKERMGQSLIEISYVYDQFDNLVCNTHNYFVYPYEKAITQVVMVEVPKLAIQEVTPEEVRSYVSQRGEGKLGSSGK